MALKADRAHYGSDISFFMNSTAERGGIVSIVTAGSGAAMDQALAAVAYQTNTTLSPAPNGSGYRPVGVLMNDVTNVDLTRTHRNFHKDEVQVGGKVTVWEKCDVTTNMIVPGTTPTAGGAAYLGPSGLITPTNIGAIASPLIGYFKSTKDQDGYAKVSINLP